MFPKEANEALRRSFPQRYKLLKMLSEAGAGLLVGTDTMVPYLIPGFTPIDEMQHFVKAGLTPYRALQAATRDPARYGLKDLAAAISCGASPRATIALAEGAQALAMLRGRNYVLPEDLTDLAADVLRHRVSLSYEALSDGLDADSLIQRIMAKMPAPARPLHHERQKAA